MVAATASRLVIDELSVTALGVYLICMRLAWVGLLALRLQRVRPDEIALGEGQSAVNPLAEGQSAVNPLAEGLSTLGKSFFSRDTLWKWILSSDALAKRNLI